MREGTERREERSFGSGGGGRAGAGAGAAYGRCQAGRMQLPQLSVPIANCQQRRNARQVERQFANGRKRDNIQESEDIGSIREVDARKQREDFKMMLLRTSREQKVSVLLDRLGNPLGRVHAGRPTNLREAARGKLET